MPAGSKEKPESITRPLYATERAMALVRDLILLYYTGMSFRGIANKYGLMEVEVMDTIGSADETIHAEMLEKAAEYPNLARRRFQGAAPAIAEKVIGEAMGDDKEFKPSARLAAQRLALESAGLLKKDSIQHTQILNVQKITKEEIDMAARLWTAAVEAELVKEPPSLPLNEPNKDG